MKIALLRSSALIALAIPGAAFAQSTGSVDFEDDAIVVTGTRATDVAGVEIPDTPKAKQVLGEEIIRRQRPGQTVNDIVNLVPGVSFQNNDPWGSGGGNFTIRGFSSDRISQTVDGIPLNDSGNYALYTNQQQDPETLGSVNVNLGSTDVDSPTASAVGGTINIRTKEPEDTFKITSSITYGDVFGEGRKYSRPYMRGFAMVDTGDLTGFGTKAFVSASYTRYDNPFNNYGVNEKQQYNARIWQDVGVNGDFIAVAGHYNENRNNFFGSQPLNNDPTRTAGPSSSQRFPLTKEERFYDINFPCTTTTPRAGVADAANSCGTEFDRRYNPSNTGNIRGASKFTIMDGLVLTIDPSFQYVKANGGGTSTAREYGYDVISAGGRANCATNPATTGQINCQVGYFGGSPYAGVDLNGDGDRLDTVTVTTPSQTRTRRYVVIGNLAYEFTPDQSVRLSYTHDRANHRQTGEAGFLKPNGEPFDVFPVNDPIVDANGNVLQKRDRQSYATLDQVSGEYRGRFGNFLAVLGLRAPFFKRDLTQNCFSTSGNANQGFVDCAYGPAAAAYQAANPYSYNTTANRPSGAALPQQRIYKYDDILPNVGFVYDLGAPSIAFNYAKGLSVPGTDPLYNSIYFPATAPGVQPEPETTDSFDLSFRYKTGNVQAQVAGWYTKYKNRLKNAYDPILDQIITRNIGAVDKYGVDGSVSYQPTRNTLLYVFGSWQTSDIKNDQTGGVCSATQAGNGQYGCTAAGQSFVVQTAGKQEAGSPKVTFGGRGQVELGDLSIGAQVKYTGKRYVNDENLPIFSLVSGAYRQTYTAQTKAYTTVDFDIRYKIAESPLGGDVAVQLNVTNLFDTLAPGGFGGSGDRYTTPFVQILPPRAASISLMFGY
ncbi:TonB-dependent receptor [Tsuneonella amylolytica]|uniref:TonB-dependent receptor n=1 Tax=Tsuneonella amylolytica TaxID=2338327 RepID=UPI000EAAAAF2|nr:TonB-dependent receptor [Tsuneonella amylolytica]